ncbi:MAG: hypothetical protein IJ354_07690 [Clostridia bacterium]|nr:hypothetical protein [Clostridia bacterium]
MNSVFQLWGIPPAAGLNREQVLAVLDRILAVHPFAVVAGQTEDTALLYEICRRAHAAGVKVHQWASLFSENDFAADFDPIVCADGSPFPRVFGEHFYFRCPGSEKNVRLFAQLQKQSMGDVPFDGVFLDRVRYPSFAHGDLQKLACFCPDCVRRYEQAGIDVNRVRRLLEQKDLSITGFSDGKPVFADTNMERFFAVRAECITQAVRMLRDFFGEVSLDLFPPSQAYLTGQSLQDLAPLAAFIKPMVYRFTTAPAGLPFEQQALEAACGSVPLPDFEKQVRQWNVITANLYWGVEGGFIPGTVETTPERIEQTLSLLRQNGANAVCASWASVLFPKENLEAFLRSCESAQGLV